MIIVVHFEECWEENPLVYLMKLQLEVTLWAVDNKPGFIGSAYPNSVNMFNFTGGLWLSWQTPSAILQAYGLFNRGSL